MNSKLIKPKQICIEWFDNEEEKSLTYNIGRFPAIDSFRMITELFNIAPSGNILEADPKDSLAFLYKCGKYIESVVINDQGEEVAVSLAPQKILEAHLPDSGLHTVELLALLIEYNVAFTKSGKQTKTSIAQ